MLATGINGRIEVIGDRIKISRKGIGSFFTHGLQGEKEILISQISAIQIKPASMLTSGYLQFGFLGSQESKGGIFSAAQDENTVMFKKNQQREFEAIKREVERIRRAGSQPEAVAFSAADEINKLAALRDKGVITTAEFDAKKNQLLGL
jgi:hypothetical protein